MTGLVWSAMTRVNRALERSPALVWVEYVIVWVAKVPPSTVPGLAVTLRAAPVSGSVAEAEGTVRVYPAWASTVCGELTLIVMSGFKAMTPTRMHPYPRSSA